MKHAPLPSAAGLKYPHCYPPSLLGLIPALLLPAAGVVRAVDLTYAPVGGSTQWADPANWTGGGGGNYPDNGSENAIIGGSRTVTLGQPFTIGGMTFTSMPSGVSTVNGGGSQLTVQGTATLHGTGQFQGGTFDFNTLVVPGGLNVGAAGTVRAATTTLGAAGGDPGSMNLLGGGNFFNQGTFTVLNESTINPGAGGGTFHNSGTFAHAGDPDLATVAANFAETGGFVRAQSGQLSFTGTTSWTGSRLTAENGAAVRIAGNSTISGVDISLSSGGFVEFRGGNHSLSGTLTAMGDGSLTEVVYDNGSGSLSGGTLSLDASAPFTAETGQIGTSGEVTNTGSFRWRGGIITGGGLANAATQPGLMEVPNSTLGRSIRNGTLSNFEHATHSGGNINIGANGRLHNLAGGTWLINGGTVFSIESGTTHLIENAGLWHQTAGGSSTVFTRFKNTTGVVRVEAGLMELRGVNEFSSSGSLEVDATASPAARLVIGGAGLTSTYTSPAFFLAGSGVVQLSSGIHAMSGDINVFGTGGIEQTSGTLRVAAGQPATLLTGAGNYYSLEGIPARIETQAALTNSGRMEWRAGKVFGTAPLINENRISVLGSVQVSDGTSARLENRNLLSVQDTATLSLDNSGVLDNAESGNVLLNGNGSIRLVSTTTTGAEFDNKGRIIKSGDGLSQVTVPFTQTTETGFITADFGDLRFSGPVALLAGTVRSDGGSADSSRVEFTGPSTLGNLRFEFSAGNHIDFHTANHVLDGTITGVGEGSARLTGGSLKPPAGGSGRFDLKGNCWFEQTAGTLGRTGATLFNDGNLIGTGGTLEGPFTNAAGALLLVNGATVSSAVTTHGTLTWRAGLITGSITNHAAGNDDAMTIEGSPAKTLATGAVITNRGSLRHSSAGSLTLQSSARIINEGGAEYELFDAATLQKAGAATNVAFENYGKVTKIGFGTTTLNLPFENEGGTVDAAVGRLILAGGVNVNGAEFMATGPAELSIRSGSVGGTVTHVLESGALPGAVRYSGTPSPVLLSGTYRSSGTGEVTFDGTLLAGASPVFNFVESAPGKFLSGTFNIQLHPLTNAGEFEWHAGEIACVSTGIVRNTGTLSIRGPSSRTLSATVGAPDGHFINNQRIFHSDNAALLFRQEATFVNTGSYRFLLDGDILQSAGGAAGSRFINPGLFEKFVGSGVTEISVRFDNPGRVRVLTGRMNFTGGVVQFSNSTLSGGTWFVNNNATLDLGPGTITTNNAVVEVVGNGFFINLPSIGSSTNFDNNGTLELRGGANLNVGGTLKNTGTLRAEAPGRITAGSVQNTGQLRGSFSIGGNVLTSGVTGPGTSPGTLVIDGSFTQAAPGKLETEIGGPAAGSQYDVLQVNGPAVLGGTLETILYGGFVPLASQSFTVLNATGITGSFDNVSSGRVPVLNGGSFAVTITGTSVTLSDYQTGAGAVQTYDQWRTQSGFFTAAEQANDAISGPNADPDLDGISNQLEFAMGTHPRQDSNSALPWLRTEGGNYIFTWQRSRTAAGALTPETSLNMTTWAQVTATPVLINETPQIQTWAVNLSPANPRDYLRLKFTP